MQVGQGCTQIHASFKLSDLKGFMMVHVSLSLSQVETLGKSRGFEDDGLSERSLFEYVCMLSVCSSFCVSTLHCIREDGPAI